MEVIPKGAFNNTNIYLSRLPNSLKRIEAEAFWDCSGLTSIDFPEGVSYIDEKAFIYCENLETITFPSSLKGIGSLAFGYCSKLNNINGGDNIEGVGTDAFIVQNGVLSTQLKTKSKALINYNWVGSGRSINRILSNINDCNVSAVSDEEYTGNEIKPIVKLDDSGVTLVENIDYTLNYADNVNVGKAIINITGIGNYTGIKKIEFNILKRSLNENNVFLSGNSFVYTGREIKPDVTVIFVDKKLQENTDYSLSYANNISAGTASIVITGEGCFSGSITKKFEIAAFSITDSMVILEKDSYSYNGKEIRPGVTVSFNGSKLNENIDYTVTYNNNSAVGIATVTITGIGSFKEVVTKSFVITKGNNSEDKSKTSNEVGSTVVIGKSSYKITSSGTVSYNKAPSKAKTIKVSAKVKIGGKTYKVTKISKDALNASKATLTKIVIPDTVTQIDKNTFNGFEKLGDITINGNKVKSIGKNAFKAIKKNAKIRIKAKKKATAEKLLKTINGKGGAKNAVLKYKKG